MALKIISSPCGCLKLYEYGEIVIEGLSVIDSDLTPANDIYVYGLRINGTIYLINRNFTSKSALLTFLNGTFVQGLDLIGTFELVGNTIVYSNFENFEEAELMIIYKNEQRCYVIGTPADPSDEENRVSWLGPTPTTVGAVVASITDVEVLQVFVGTSYYKKKADLYAQVLDNEEIMVLTQQKPGFAPIENEILAENGQALYTEDNLLIEIE